MVPNGPWRIHLPLVIDDMHYDKVGTAGSIDVAPLRTTVGARVDSSRFKSPTLRTHVWPDCLHYAAIKALRPIEPALGNAQQRR